MTHDELVELAATVHHDARLLPGQYTWEQLVERGDDRIPIWRQWMAAAVDAVLERLEIELEEIDG